MKTPARFLFCVLALLALVVPGAVHAAPTPVSPVEAAEALGLQCAQVTSADGIRYTRCEGEITSFDGTGLDTTLSLPVQRDEPYPTLLMLHGWGGHKGNWQATTTEGDGNPDKWHWNNVWFVQKGYAVVNYTARGFGESCGAHDNEPDCTFDGARRPWIHLADRRWETKDSQHILGLLVDAGIADPRRLASTGGSYGGGQSWLLATSTPWTSPGGHGGLQLAGAVPKYPWTDLINALIPNGRASDDLNQNASHEEPFGVMKLSYVSGLYASGQPPVGHGRYNTYDPTETHSQLHEQYARTLAGEPYDPDATIDAFVAEFRQKSAYHANDYFTAVAAEASPDPSDDRPGFEEVPVFSVQGWTDPLFPAVETLQMYRKLKAVDPDYPIYMAFGDIGHSNAQNPFRQWRLINNQGNQFLDTFVLGQGRSDPTTTTLAFITQCPETDEPQPPLSSTEWDRMTHGTVTLQGGGGRTTTSGQNPGLSDDPVFSEPPNILASRGCITKPPGEDEAEAATWEFPVPERFTMLGLPEARLPYTLTGADATVAVRIWDIPPSGEKVLVDRSAYRLNELTNDNAGVIDMDLFGNAWEWLPGHTIQLQVSQRDAPFLRPDNLQSSIAWGSRTVTIPIRQGFDLTLTAP